MSFWNLSTGESATDTGTEYEIPGGNMEPIPDGSSVLAIIDEAKWKKKDQNDPASPEYIELRWTIMEPAQYKNRKVFHKLWVTDLDPGAKDKTKAIAKQDKARKMLAAIDANAGGKLSRSPGIPTDETMGVALLNKPMVITLMTWEVSDSRGTASGNWVSAVSPKTRGVEVKEAAPKRQSAAASASRDDDFGEKPAQYKSYAQDDDSDIPF